jgi:hypothetical protein
LSCVFMNHFRMSDDCAPRKQSKNRSVVVGGQEQEIESRTPLRSPNKSPRRGNTNRRAQERERGQERTHHLRRSNGRARETEKLEIFPDSWRG